MKTSASPGIPFLELFVVLFSMGLPKIVFLITIFPIWIAYIIIFCILYPAIWILTILELE